VKLRRWTAAVGAFLLWLGATAGDARAAGAPRIILIAPTGDDPISLRLQAELRSLHFDVPEIEVEIAPEPPSRAQLEDAARKSEAVAAVRIVPSKTGVEVWIVDRITGKTVLREMVTTAGGAASRDATIALRVVELLRASLMELDADRPPQGEMETPPLVRELMAPPRIPAAATVKISTLPPLDPPAFSIELGPAAVLSPGGFGPSGAVSAAVYYHPAEPFGVNLIALIPVLPATVSGPEGATTARIGLLGGGLRGTWIPAGSAWALSLGGGLAALWLHLDGQPAPGFGGASKNLFSAAPYLRAGLGITVLPRLRLRADALLGASLPPTLVRFGERLAAVWGVPFAAPTLGVELFWQ
jgi:hypothetical protein